MDDIVPGPSSRQRRWQIRVMFGEFVSFGAMCVAHLSCCLTRMEFLSVVVVNSDVYNEKGRG